MSDKMNIVIDGVTHFNGTFEELGELYIKKALAEKEKAKPKYTSEWWKYNDFGLLRDMELKNAPIDNSRINEPRVQTENLWRRRFLEGEFLKFSNDKRSVYEALTNYRKFDFKKCTITGPIMDWNMDYNEAFWTIRIDIEMYDNTPIHLTYNNTTSKRCDEMVKHVEAVIDGWVVYRGNMDKLNDLRENGVGAGTFSNHTIEGTFPIKTIKVLKEFDTKGRTK